MGGGSVADDELKAAEGRLQEALGKCDALREKVKDAEGALAKLVRSRPLGKTTVRPDPAEVVKAWQAIKDANGVLRAATEARQLREEEVRKAKAAWLREHPERFVVKPLELPKLGGSAEGLAEPARAALEGPQEAGRPAEDPSPPPPPHSGVALLFPGQGSQVVGMVKQLREDSAVQALAASAERVLGWNPLTACLEGPEDRLAETSVCQPCVLFASMAALSKLQKERPEAVERPGAVAGLSLGEYTALCVAGVFTFAEAMELVKVRSTAMAEAAASRPQAMLSVFGLDQDKLEELCREQAVGNEVCQIANHLFPRGFSCSGTFDAIKRLEASTTQAGALQSRLLKTSGGFHTELMKPAQRKLELALDAMLPAMKPPKVDVYMNVTGRKVKAGTAPAEFVPLLAKQLCSPVLWEASMQQLIADGMAEFYEVGPMKQLKAMMKRINVDAWGKTQNVDVGLG